MADTRRCEIDAQLARIADDVAHTRSLLARSAADNEQLREELVKLCRDIRCAVARSRKRLGGMTRRRHRPARLSGTIQRRSGLPPARLRRVTAYIDASLAEHLDVSKLAAVAGMSNGYFAAQFKQSTGLSPHRFVVQRRLWRARGLLARNSDTIASIGYQVGFSSQAHLTTAFRQHFHVTPSAFRTAQRCEPTATRTGALIPGDAVRRSEESESHKRETHI